MSYWVNADYPARVVRVHTSECPHVEPYGESPGAGLWREFRTLPRAREAASVLIGRGDVQMCDVCHPIQPEFRGWDSDETFRSSATPGTG